MLLTQTEKSSHFHPPRTRFEEQVFAEQAPEFKNCPSGPPCFLSLKNFNKNFNIRLFMTRKFGGGGNQALLLHFFFFLKKQKLDSKQVFSLRIEVYFLMHALRISRPRLD